MKQFDVAIIGSGPISLFEAIHQAQQGKSVAIIEEKDNLGGAWTSVEYEPGHRYEIGCHIWDINKEAYRFVEEYLGEKLKPLNPPATAIWRNIKMPYDWKNNVIALRFLLEKPTQIFSSKRKFRMRVMARNYYYPKGGSEILIKNLLSDVKRLNISVMKGSTVRSVQIDEAEINLVLDGYGISVKELMCTSFSNFSEVIVKGEKLISSQEEEDFWHFQFVVEDNEARRMSYARILGHPFIQRVSDISFLNQGGGQVFSIGVFANSTQNMTREDVVSMIESSLRNWEWLSPEAKVVKAFDNRYVMKRPCLEQRQALINSGRVTFIQSTNLIFGIAQNADRWRKTVLMR